MKKLLIHSLSHSLARSLTCVIAKMQKFSVHISHVVLLLIANADCCVNSTSNSHLCFQYQRRHFSTSEVCLHLCVALFTVVYIRFCNTVYFSCISSMKMAIRLLLVPPVSILSCYYWEHCSQIAGLISTRMSERKCMEYEVDSARPRGGPKKTWRDIVEKDCQARGLNREDAMDHIRWMKQIRDFWWPR